MRFFRVPTSDQDFRGHIVNGLDSMAGPAPEHRLEFLRELVDELPEQQALVVSLYFFGAGPVTLKRIAEETHMSVYQTKRILADAFANLRATLLEDDQVGPVLAEHGPRSALAALLSAPPVAGARHDA